MKHSLSFIGPRNIKMKAVVLVALVSEISQYLKESEVKSVLLSQ